MTMIALDTLKSNPFRDFALYPLDDEQVQRLALSINELGFFAGVTARKNGKGHELAAGHHRVKAAKLSGLTEIDATVKPYTDEQMVKIMSKENLTQRGHNAASVLDSVAAYSRLIAKQVLLGEGDSWEFLQVSGDRFATKAQTEIAQSGPGRALLYRAINGFELSEARDRKNADKNAETISENEIKQTLAALKEGGHMAKIVAEVYAQVEAIRAERDAEAQAEAERKAEAERRAQEQAEAEVQEAQAEAETAKAEHVAAESEAEEQRAAVGRAATDKEIAAAERAAKQAEKDAEEKAQKAREAEQEAERRATAAAHRASLLGIKAAELKAKIAAEGERRKKEREAIKAQSAKDAAYDVRCGNVFRLTSHEAAFREAVLTDNGRLFISVDQQLPLAQHIRAEIDRLEKGMGNRDLGSVSIKRMVGEVVTHALKTQKMIDDVERRRLLELNAIERINDKWKQVAASVARTEKFLRGIVEEEQKWDYASPFPMNMLAMDRLAMTAKLIAALRKKFSV